jgi:cellulose synthase/poly-beta-1,6-N-acetylglucosamine synthase-like glycosyltransferase
MLLTLAETLLCFLALVVLIPTSVLFVQVLMAMPVRHAKEMLAGRRPSVAVVVPAHNEARGIAATLRQIVPQLERGDRLIVVADNCTDETASIATQAGAHVLERSDSQHRGKGYALDFGVRHLQRNPPEVVVVIDADCNIDGGALERLACLCFESRRPVQGLDLMVSPKGSGLSTRIAEFAWVVKNHVRPLGFQRLDLPCQLMGTGMAFPWPVISSAAFATGHIVEDLKLGIDLARAGTPALFCPEARVTSYFPETPKAIGGQRTRWEHGHLGMIFDTTPRLILEALRHRNGSLLALSLDMSVPPLALLLLLTSTVVVTNAVFGRWSGLLPPLWLALISLTMLAIAVLLSWIRFGRQIVSFSALAFAPLYALIKTPVYLKFLVRRQAEWVRSKRDGE